ncbi:hypothetical protein C7I84_26345 [Mesorhizobium ephedrae]|uniref:Uncharacterized protein n=2 Tax=Kumtagia ephedrae TaxID=2116701 RepID=A0A2P7RQT4_9HYPH|nr:hypothetical protein C7I84_26345 [Mesorhizobium ephedrae]
MMRLGYKLAGAAMSAALALAVVAPAPAWERDRVYADSFGNLVIESAAGYKRILVGEGHEAERLASYVGAGQPEVAYADEDGAYSDDVNNGAALAGCYRPPVLVKGRSYMYGFDQGEIPLQGGPCR